MIVPTFLTEIVHHCVLSRLISSLYYLLWSVSSMHENPGNLLHRFLISVCQYGDNYMSWIILAYLVSQHNNPTQHLSLFLSSHYLSTQPWQKYVRIDYCIYLFMLWYCHTARNTPRSKCVWLPIVITDAGEIISVSWQFKAIASWHYEEDWQACSADLWKLSFLQNWWKAVAVESESAFHWRWGDRDCIVHSQWVILKVGFSQT